MQQEINNFTLLEGIISVEAVINSGKRNIEKVYIDRVKYQKRDRKITHMISVLKSKSIYFELCDRTFIDELCEGSSHGGVVAIATERTYTGLDCLLSVLSGCEYLCSFDGVEDPYNFGYSLRNMYAFGCRGFIVPKRNWMTSANIVAKSSAGASELCEMAISENDEELVSLIKKHNIDIVCSALSHTSVSLFDFKPDRPFVLFIGGEKRGISKTIFENANKVVHIPYGNENAKYSLPTASCAAIFAYHLSNTQK